MTDDPRLPLTPLTMAILLALAEEDQHGYALLKSIIEQTDGELRPGTGSLYAALQRLMDDGLIVESTAKPGPGEDKRRRIYGITKEGRALARAEATRMSRVVRLAQARRLGPNPGPS